MRFMHSCMYTYCMFSIINQYTSRITTKDEAFRFTFLDPVDGYIELVLEDMAQVTSQGWNIEPHKEPLRVRI